MSDYHRQVAKRPQPWRRSITSVVHALFTLIPITMLSEYCAKHHPDKVILMGPFGASAVLMYNVHQSSFAQPRNVIFGHTLSGLVGVTINKLFGSSMSWLAPGLAVGLAGLVMERMNCIHPPGGATALLAVIGSDQIKREGYAYVITPCLAVSIFMVVMAVLTSYVDRNRQYPLSWDLHPFPKRKP